MAEHASIAEARDLPGLRLLLLKGLPSPWGQAAKGIFAIKKLPYVRVHQAPGDAPGLLREWTGQESFPVAAYEQERPRSGWAEILLLAERLAPEPALIPRDPEQRLLFFGAAHEVCGEMGLGWCRRLVSLHSGLEADPQNAFLRGFGAKYGYSKEAARMAPARCVAVLGQLDGILERSRLRGGSYLLGDSLSALDVYWATFSNLIDPLPPEQCPMPDALRPMFTARDPETLAAFTPALRRHRDLVFERHLGLPMDL